MLSTLKEFCDTTSVAPYSKIANSTSLTGRVLWIIILVLSVVGLLTHLTYLTIHFNSQPISVNVDLVSGGIDFPDVIVCPTMYWSHALIKRDPDQKFVKMSTAIESVCVQKGNSNEYCNSFAKDVMIEALRNNKVPFLRDYIYLRENFILSCEYNHVACSWQDFQPILTSQYGICYKFTPPNANLQFEHFFGGLKLLTYIEDVQFAETLDKHVVHTRGNLVFVVSNNSHIDFYREAPISVSAGQANAIGVSFSKINHQNTNKHPCAHTMTINDHNVVKTIPYKHLSCLDAKINDDIIKSCSCLSSSVIHTSKYNSSYFCLNLKIDSMGNVTNVDALLKNHECEKAYLKSLDKLSVYANNYCKKSCHTEIPNLLVSSAFLSAESGMAEEYEEIVVNRYKQLGNFTQNTINEILNSTLDGLKSYSVIRNNLVMINAYIQSSEVLIYHEYVSYTLVNYLSEGSGVFGAWAGISIVSIFEFFELFGNMFLFYKRRRVTGAAESAINLSSTTNL